MAEANNNSQVGGASLQGLGTIGAKGGVDNSEPETVKIDNTPKFAIEGLDTGSFGSGDSFSVNPKGTIQPNDVSQTRSDVVAPIPLSMQYDEEQATANMAAAVSGEIDDFTEEELLKDKTFSYASKKMYRLLKGQDFMGNEEEANQYGIDLMRMADNNLVALGSFVNDTSDMTPEDAQTALYMMDMFEAKDFTMGGVGDAIVDMGLDPTTYLGLATFGWGFAGKQAAKVAAKKGLVSRLQKVAFSNAGIGGIEGAAYGAAFEHGKQRISENGGQGYDSDSVALNAGAGLVLGATAAHYVPKAMEWSGDKARGLYERYLPKTDKVGESAGENMDLSGISPELVQKATRGDKDAAKAITEGIFERNFQRIMDYNTGHKLKPMMLDKLQQNPNIVQDLAAKYDYKFKYFSHNPDSLGKDIGDGVIETPPKGSKKLKEQGYDAGNIWVYDPLDEHGAFNDPEYTKAWRQVHELSHAITEHMMQEKYGNSKRFGSLSFDMQNPYDALDPRSYKGLTLAQAQRAIEWEDVAFRTQVKLLDEMGIDINAKEAVDDWNLAATDTLVRVLTGDFSDPATHGVITDGMTEKIKTQDVLQVLENQELLNAKFQGRKPTLGTDLLNFDEITEEHLANNIKNFTKRKTPESINLSIESITGEDTTGAAFKKALDGNEKLKAEYHEEMKPIILEMLDEKGLAYEKADTLGVYKGEFSPQTQFDIKIPKEGITPAFKKKFEEAAREIAEELQQDSLGYNLVTQRAQRADGAAISDANGNVITGFKETPTKEETQAFVESIEDDLGAGGIVVTTADGFKVWSTGEHTGEEINAAALRAAELVKGNNDTKIFQANIDGDTIAPNWKGLEDGTTQKLTEKSGSQTARNRAKKIRDIQKRTKEKAAVEKDQKQVSAEIENLTGEDDGK